MLEYVICNNKENNNKENSVVLQVTGEVLETCIISDNGSQVTHVCYIESEGFIYCLTDNGDIMVYITSGTSSEIPFYRVVQLTYSFIHTPSLSYTKMMVGQEKVLQYMLYRVSQNERYTSKPP